MAASIDVGNAANKVFIKPHILKHYLIIIPLLIPFFENARNTTPPPESHPIAAVDVYRMAAILEAEAIGEPYQCQCLVGQVWLNRGKSNEGFARKKPTPNAIKIAKKVLTSQHKHRLNYFYNPATSTDLEFLRWAAKFPKVRCGKQLFFSDECRTSKASSAHFQYIGRIKENENVH